MKRLMILCSLWLSPWTGDLVYAKPSCDLTTEAERSGWSKTGRYAEVTRLTDCFASRYSKQVKAFRFGVTPEGRELIGMVLGKGIALTPDGAHKLNRPVLFFQGGIHAGEIDGKDAGFLVVREILEGKILPGILDRLTLVFVPVFNVDGHERFGPNNRPNQVGPEEMGWRTTAQNYNLNRDYMKADSPEMQAMLKLLNTWDPIVMTDLHVTDGADYQVDVSVAIEPSGPESDELASCAKSLRTRLVEKLKAFGHVPFGVYPNFIDPDNPLSGISEKTEPPRFSHIYWGTNNRIGILVETHSWKNYATRIKATRDLLYTLFEEAQNRSAQWLDAAARRDQQASQLAGRNFALTYKTTEKFTVLEFPGYHFVREKSAISGELETSYDPKLRETWKVPVFSEVVAQSSVKAPQKGYIIPPAYRELVTRRLAYHGIKALPISTQREGEVEVYRAQEVSYEKRSFEGHIPTHIRGAWKKEKQIIPAGSVFVPIEQPHAPVAIHLLEPEGPDSLAAWGFFNTAFEQKEYMENYVAHQLGTQLIATHPEIRTEFEAKLKSDPDFAKSRIKRLYFFYRRHSSWDDRWNLYPIYREN